MSDPKSLWREYDAAKQPEHDIRIAVAGSFTTDPITPYLGGALLAKGYKAPAITIGPFNQIQQICDNYKSVLGGDGPNAIVLLWRLEDLFPASLTKTLSDEGALTELLDNIRALVISIRKLRADFDGMLVVSTPPYPSFPGFDLEDITPSATHRMALKTWQEGIAEIEGVRLLDLDQLIARHGYAKAHDARKWYLYHQPYAETFWQDIGRQAARIIAAESISPKKCIVLDCDNTLWGGIVGEDGLGGVALGDEFPGSAFRDFQKQLLHLKTRGVMLAIASKNNPDDVYEMFDKHDAMALSRNDIAVFEVHWDSKANSIRRVAEKLNIGLDALVFIDDNAKEIDEIHQRLPEVTCLMVPEEIAELPALLKGTDLFDKHDITEEDRKRTEMVMAEGARLQLQETLSEADFKASLELKVDMFQADKQHLARVTQLINKTNQFNLTTIRRTAEEVQALCEDKNTLVLGTEISDKYGEYGLVSIAILKHAADSKICHIDTLLMSCRVLGRDAETAIIAQLGKAAQKLGADELRGKYIPTAKNAMVKDLYAKFGFKHDAATNEWAAKIADIPASPGHITATLKLLKDG